MNKTKAPVIQFLSIVSIAITLFSSCAKEKPFDTQYREERLDSRSAIKVEEMVTNTDGKQVMKPVEYLYVPMTLSTPMNVVEADPFFQGDEKVVRLQWAEEGLEVVEIERDNRFVENDQNSFPVLTIPVEYKSFRCQEDAYGDCNNREEVNTELEWNENTYFKPNFEKMKVKELNMLDLMTLASDSCISQGETKLIDYEISEGVIYIEVEKSYSFDSKIFCIWDNYVNDRLSNNSFKARHSYSLVRLDKLASKNYKPVNYPVAEHDRFGFFTKERKVLNNDFDSQRENQEIFMERWNPERPNGEVVYYLSPSYSKPENKAILEATHAAVEIMNKEMSEGSVPLRLKLIEQQDPSKAVSTGDLRYTTLVLIEDPLANGLLGYGPAVSNPYTGEIVQAHTNMYLGVLKSMTRRVYNNARDLVKEQLDENKEVKSINTMNVKNSALNGLPDALIDSYVERHASQNKEIPSAQRTALNNSSVAEHSAFHRNHEHVLTEMTEKKVEQRYNNYISRKIDLRMERAIQISREQENDMTKEEKFIARDQRRLDHFAENNAYAVEFFSIGGTSKVVFPKLKDVEGIWNNGKDENEAGTLKPWSTLTSEQQAIVQEIILVQTYKSTLIHEIGHNLGLRHNFRGSTDKENFFSEDEAKALGMSAAPAYSSIMDYGFSEFNELKALGKYDVAALRYGYARELELTDGSFAKVKTDVASLEKEIKGSNKEFKAYGFCTDGHAGLSSFCNRFDEGTTLTEITGHLIKRYDDVYKYRNFRDERLDFSSYGILSYHLRTNRDFSKIRDMIEDYEFFAGIFGAELMAQGCSPDDVAQYPVCTRINDYRDAVMLAGDFFIKVLKTPDHICAIASSDDPKSISEYRKLSEIYNKDLLYSTTNYVSKSCFDKEVKDVLEKDSLTVVGEAGKFLNGFKGNDPRFKYVNDRAVRGIWNDKVIALKFLFSRVANKSTTDTSHMALVDIQPIREKLENVLGHFVQGKPLEETIPFKTEDGSLFSAPYVIGRDYQIEPVESIFASLKRSIGLDDAGQTSYVKLALNQISRFGTTYGSADSDKAYLTRNYAAVVKRDGFFPEDQRVESDVYFYDQLTRDTFVGTEVTPLAKNMITLINEKSFLDSVPKYLYGKVITRRTNPDAPADMNNDDAAFFEISEEQRRIIILNRTQGTNLVVAAFTDFFKDEALGRRMYNLYQKGIDHMTTLASFREEMMTTIATDATDIEKKLFDISLESLEDYRSGRVTDQLIEYYKAQLRIMPIYKDHALAI